MPIKLPTTIAPLLAWSRNEVTDPLQRRAVPLPPTSKPQSLWDVNGFHKSNGILPSAPNAYLAKEPIVRTTTHQTDDLFPQIMMMVAAASQDAAVVNDEDRLCRIFEAFVDPTVPKRSWRTIRHLLTKDVLLELMRELPSP